MIEMLIGLLLGRKAAPASEPARPVMEAMEDRRLLAAGIPRFDHVVVVIEENHAYNEIIGTHQAPFINNLARHGVLFTQSFAVSHPSQPNYLALFAGTTYGIADDNNPGVLPGPNLAGELRQQKLSFAGYTDGIVPKHNPWLDYAGLPRWTNQPMSKFPRDFSKLPTVSFIAPNQMHDMHDGSISQGDSWLSRHLTNYAKWARTHNSLLIVTFDEDDYSQGNQVPTLMYGVHVQAGKSSQVINQYNLLRTIEDMYSLPYMGNTATASPITGVWRA